MQSLDRIEGDLKKLWVFSGMREELPGVMMILGLGFVLEGFLRQAYAEEILLGVPGAICYLALQSYVWNQKLEGEKGEKEGDGDRQNEGLLPSHLSFLEKTRLRLISYTGAILLAWFGGRLDFLVPYLYLGYQEVGNLTLLQAGPQENPRDPLRSYLIARRLRGRGELMILVGLLMHAGRGSNGVLFLAPLLIFEQNRILSEEHLYAGYPWLVSSLFVLMHFSLDPYPLAGSLEISPWFGNFLLMILQVLGTDLGPKGPPVGQNPRFLRLFDRLTWYLLSWAVSLLIFIPGILFHPLLKVSLGLGSLYVLVMGGCVVGMDLFLGVIYGLLTQNGPILFVISQLILFLVRQEKQSNPNDLRELERMVDGVWFARIILIFRCVLLGPMLALSLLTRHHLLVQMLLPLLLDLPMILGKGV